MKNVKRILDHTYHRNGISGAPFWLIMFESTRGEVLMATMFKHQGHCAVHDPWHESPLNQKYRGDCFEAELREMIKED